MSSDANPSREFYERALAQIPVRWNCLDPNDEHSALIVPREDLRALEAERDQLREALSDLMQPLANLKGYRTAEQGPFLAHVDAIERRVVDALNQEQQR